MSPARREDADRPSPVRTGPPPSGERAVHRAEFRISAYEEQIADATGLTAVHTNRTLQGLRKDRLLSLSAAELKVPDWEALAVAGDFSERYLHHEQEWEPPGGGRGL